MITLEDLITGKFQTDDSTEYCTISPRGTVVPFLVIDGDIVDAETGEILYYNDKLAYHWLTIDCFIYKIERSENGIQMIDLQERMQ